MGLSSTVQSNHAHMDIVYRHVLRAAKHFLLHFVQNPLAAYRFPINDHFSVCAADALLIARFLRTHRPAAAFATAKSCFRGWHYAAGDTGPVLGSRTKKLSIYEQNSVQDNDSSSVSTHLPIDVIPPEISITGNGSASLPRPSLQPHFFLRGGVVAAAAAAPPERPDCIVVSGRRPRVDTDGGRQTNAAVELMQCFAPRPVWLKKKLHRGASRHIANMERRACCVAAIVWSWCW